MILLQKPNKQKNGEPFTVLALNPPAVGWVSQKGALEYLARL